MDDAGLFSVVKSFTPMLREVLVSDILIRFCERIPYAFVILWAMGHDFTITDEPSGRSGRMAYRTTQKLPALSAGKKAFLWIGATDGTAKVFVNGTHVKYIVPEKTREHEAGDVLDAFDGYCKPARFDITAALKTGDNQFTILCDRHHLNELGTGGLIGPVVLYREK